MHLPLSSMNTSLSVGDPDEVFPNCALGYKPYRISSAIRETMNGQNGQQFDEHLRLSIYVGANARSLLVRSKLQERVVRF